MGSPQSADAFLALREGGRETLCLVQGVEAPQQVLMVYISNNISWKDEDPSIPQAAAAVMVR